MNRNVRRFKISLTLPNYAVWTVLAVLFLTRPGLAQGHRTPNTVQPSDLHSYQVELERYSRRIAQSEGQPAEISEIRKSLPPYWSVEQAGARFQIPTDSLDAALADLQAHPSRAAQITRDIQFYLEEMRQSASAMETAADRPTDLTARANLNTIFAQRDFKSLKGPSELELLENRIGGWVAAQMLRVLSGLNLSEQTGNRIAWTIIALAFLAICYWIYRTPSRRMPADEGSLAAPVLEANDSRQWLRDAVAAGDSGDYREAVHCAYWATIARLEQLLLLERDRSRTPRESLGLLRTHPNEHASLRTMTGHFERIWYGYKPASAADWSEAKVLLEKLGCLAALTAQTANS